MKRLINAQMRWLEAPQEIDEVDFLIVSRGWMPINHAMARILGTFDETGKMVGFLVVKMMPHIEPIYVDPEWRGSGVAEEMAEFMAKTITAPPGSVFMVADNPLSAQLGRAHGMVKLETPVYVNGA